MHDRFDDLVIAELRRIHKGFCPVCHKIIHVRKDGLLQQHTTIEQRVSANMYGSVNCPGAGGEPMRIAASWDAGDKHDKAI